MPGDRMNPKARQALEEIGVDPGEHQAQGLELGTLQEADCVYVMTSFQKNLLAGVCPEKEENISVLNVADPFGGSMEDYRNCRDQLREAMKDIVRKVQ